MEPRMGWGAGWDPLLPQVPGGSAGNPDAHDRCVCRGYHTPHSGCGHLNTSTIPSGLLCIDGILSRPWEFLDFPGDLGTPRQRIVTNL